MKSINFTQLDFVNLQYCGEESALCRLIFGASSITSDGLFFEDGLFAFIPPGEKYHVTISGTIHSVLELSFSAELLTPSLSNIFKGQEKLYLQNPAPEFLEYASSFCKMLSLPQPISLEATETGLLSILSMFSHFLVQSNEDISSHAKRLVSLAKDIVRSEYAGDVSLQSVATKLFVNSCYLSTIFHQVTGETFRSYLRDVRLEHVAQLLVQTNDTVTDISMRTGFNSTAYMISSFRKVYGITPNAYRIWLQSGQSS